MDVPAVIFRQYDIRGVVGKELTPEVGHAIGRALTTYGRRSLGGDPRIAVGFDNRPSGEILSRSVRDGIAAAGGVAVDIGTIPTPALYLAEEELNVDGGIQITGSHNPPEFNGFKMNFGGKTLFGDSIQEIYGIIKNDLMDAGVGSIEADDSVLSRYVDAVTKRNGPINRPIKVVVDCGNGVASLVAEKILTRIGAEVVPLFCESDGTFPNHHPDPTVVENLKDLQETVRRTKADLGIAFDGDGDRIGVVDENGRVIFGDQLLVLFGRDLVNRGFSGSPVVFDVKCSHILAQKLTEAGLEPVMYKTGHSLIKARMSELGAPLAGEMSGHMFFGGDYYGFDDAIFAAARLLAYFASQEGSFSDMLADLPKTFATPEIRIACPDEEKVSVVKEAAEHFSKKYDATTIDGIRINFPEGWGLIRSSNTQPVLVTRFEATSEELLAEYRNEIEDWMRARGIEV